MNDIIISENLNAVDVFSGGTIDTLIAKIEAEAKSLVPDLETKKGRDSIASMAHKVAKAKTYLDGLGKDLVSDWKTKAKAVDNDRKKMRDALDALKDEVRRPLTEWENAEKEKIERLEAGVSAMVNDGLYCGANWQTIDRDDLTIMLDRVKATKMGAGIWGDLSGAAAVAKDGAISKIEAAIAQRDAYDADQTELAKLRAAQQAQEKAEAEERLRLEGEERIRLAAEQKAKDDAQKAEIATRAAIEEKEKAEARAKLAEETAKQQAEEAAQAERDRIEQERIEAEQAAKKREADINHRKKINNAAVDAIVATGITKPKAIGIVTAIAKGQIPHIKISY